jgi:hypothetical protein
LLTVATVWRWAWLGVVQRRVGADLRGDPPLPLRRRLMPILLARLVSNVAMTWGGILIVPMFYGFFVSGFATPLLLESEEPALPRLLRLLGWLHGWAGRLIHVSVALSVAMILAVVGVIVVQLLLVWVMLGSLLALDTSNLQLTMGSVAWVMCVSYFLFVLFDVYWTVASVILFYDLQSQRLGTDLRLRLRTLREGQ